MEGSALERGLSRLTDTLSKQIDTWQRDKDDEKNSGEGTMGYLKTHNKYLVFLARNCDRHPEVMCVGVLGRDLFDCLRRSCDVARHVAMSSGSLCPSRTALPMG